VLQALSRELRTSSHHRVVVFLGDNVYPRGLLRRARPTGKRLSGGWRHRLTWWLVRESKATLSRGITTGPGIARRDGRPFCGSRHSSIRPVEAQFDSCPEAAVLGPAW